MVAMVVGFTGCGGEEPPVSPPPLSSASPAVKSTTPPKDTPTPKETPAVPAAKEEGSTKEPAASKDAPALEAPKTGAAEDAAKPKLSDKQLAGIKELPEPEQAAAIKQAVCPVSDEPLGSMGKPIKVTAENRTFYLCCDGCEDLVKSDPKKVVAKLDKPR